MSTSSSNSANDVVFNGNTFVQNLPLILAETTQTTFNAQSVIDNPQSFSIPANLVPNRTLPAFSGQLNLLSGASFFTSSSTTTNPFTTLSSFVSSYAQYVTSNSTSLANTYNADGIAFEGIGPAILSFLQPVQSQLATNLQTALQQDFETQIGYPAAFANLNPPITDSTITQWFTNSFNNFLANYPYDSNGSTTESEFFANWSSYMANTANVALPNTTVSVDSTSINLDNYETVYNSFFPNNTAAQYQADLASFITAQETANGNLNAANGWFIPSQSFNQFFNQMLTKYQAGNVNTSVELATTVGTAGSASALLVISRILTLLINMVNILQQISASQAGQLSFDTNWESAYTNLLTQVPQFSPGGGKGVLNGNSSKAEAFDNKIVNPHMQAISQNVQAQQTNVQNTAKSQQTNINQSQDASNQLSQMITSVIQQLSTILSSIYH